MTPWERLDRILDRIEQTLLVLFLSFMVSVAFSQIVLRNVFATGLAWSDSMLRNLVLWVGFLGATLATREGKHINIDILSRHLPSAGKDLAAAITRIFSFLVCLFLTYGALKFIRNESAMGNVTFLGIPAWIPEMILPGTFGLMSFRFALHFLQHVSMLRRGRKSRGQGEER